MSSGAEPPRLVGILFRGLNLRQLSEIVGPLPLFGHNYGPGERHGQGRGKRQ
jgi:hypothetical protein